MKEIRRVLQGWSIKRIITTILILFVFAFMLNASYIMMMRKVVHLLPPSIFWTYHSIKPLQTEYKIWDRIDFNSKNIRNIDLRIIFEDYLYCEGDKIDEIKKERYLYTSTFLWKKGKVDVNWTFGKTERSLWYKLKKTWTWCYILSHQTGFPYGEEIVQEFKSWPFNIIK